MNAPSADATAGATGWYGALTKRDRGLAVLTVATTVAAALSRLVGGVTAFVVAGVALALLAALVGRAVEALGDRVSPAATGILQSGLGNLPELLILVFALRAGLVTVVQATIVGSILANVALVLGVAFVVGGLTHGTQQFSGVAARELGLNLLLAVAALALPSVTALLHAPAAPHERALSIITSVVLLVAFGLSLVHTFRPSQRRQDEPAEPADEPTEKERSATTPGAGEGPGDEAGDGTGEEQGVGWPLWLAIAVLAVSGVLAALVSDWFVAALTPAMSALHISDAFAGLVVVAIAGNAVENFVGIQLALRNDAETALQVVLQSPVQIAMFVAPVVLLAAPLLGAGGFTLVLPPLLLVSLLASALLAVFITLDGESTWYEGTVLIAIYALIATCFWWG